MNVLVVNLTRFGDLLQSQAAIAGLARQGHSVGLLCLENFQGAGSLVCRLSGLFALPGARLLYGLDKAWPGAVADLEAWATVCMEAFPPDNICNLTPSLNARLLCRYLALLADKLAGPHPRITGFGMDEAGFGRNTSLWASFLQSSSRVRGLSPFNVVDLFRNMAGTGAIPPDASLTAPGQPDQAAVRQRLLALLPPEAAGSRGFIALQPGASEERRRWPEQFFAALASTVWREEGLVPLLLGSRAERNLTEGIAGRITGPSVNMAGETSLPELAAALSLSRLLVSNDTGTMHLAAGLNIPVLAFFLATAQPWDTGPYRNGCCSLEPDLPCHPCSFGAQCPREHACRFSITPELAASLALTYVRTGTWMEPGSSLANRGARVWQSVQDDHLLMDLRSLSGHEHTDRTLWLREQRHFYRQFLDRNSGRPFVPTPLDAVPAFSADFSAALRRELATTVSLLDALGQQGTLLLVRPLPQIKDRFLASLSRLDTLFRESRHLAALSLLWAGDAHGNDDLGSVVDRAAQYRTLLSALLSRLG